MDREIVLLSLGLLVLAILVAFRHMMKDVPPTKPVTEMSVKELVKTKKLTKSSKPPIKCKK